MTSHAQRPPLIDRHTQVDWQDIWRVVMVSSLSVMHTLKTPNFGQVTNLGQFKIDIFPESYGLWHPHYWPFKTTSLHTRPITGDVKECLYLIKHHNPSHTPATFNKKQSNDWMQKTTVIRIEMSSVILCWIYPKLSLWELTVTCIGKSYQCIGARPTPSLGLISSLVQSLWGMKLSYIWL